MTYDYGVDYQVYVEMSDIYRKLDYRKKDSIESQKYLQKLQFGSNRYR